MTSGGVSAGDGRTAPSIGGRAVVRLLPAVALGLGLVLVVSDVMLSAITIDLPRPVDYEAANNPLWVHLFGGVFDLAALSVAALIAARRPHNPIGWILLGIALGLPLNEAAERYARLSLSAADGGLPGTLLVAWTTNWSWALTVLAVPFLLLLFPDGRLSTRRWQPVLWTAAVNAAVIVSVTAAWPGLDAFPGVQSPFGVAALDEAIVERVLGVGFTVHAVASVLAVVSLLLRYRRGDTVERRQLQWFAYAAVVLVVIINVTPSSVDPVAFELLEELAGLGLMTAVAIAILRYRLYEIDRIVSRTATYAVVSAVLVGVYALVAVVPSVAFDLESDLLVAAATLAAAGVFVPLRRRVQVVVDRRFNRARYDAAQVVEGFGDRLRDDLDLDGLAGDLRRVVASTVQPDHVSLWMPEERAR
ncbi:hypothetical protein BH23ACT10_BH23ACT10_16370 [soil metagenome]